MEDIAKVVVLHREFPAWAVWLPAGDRPWTAARAESSQAPTKDVPMIWVHGRTAAQLADRMEAQDAHLTTRPPLPEHFPEPTHLSAKGKRDRDAQTEGSDQDPA